MPVDYCAYALAQLAMKCRRQGIRLILAEMREQPATVLSRAKHAELFSDRARTLDEALAYADPGKERE